MKIQDDCVFCKIAAGEIPAKVVYEDDYVIAFHDLHPQATYHVLLVPKHHSENILILAAEEEGPVIVEKLLAAIAKVAEELGLTKSGFRLINNCGKEAGQSVMHLHIHLLSGKRLSEKIV